MKMLKTTLKMAAAALAFTLAGTSSANVVGFVETFSDADGNLDGFDFDPFIDDTVGYSFGVNDTTDTFDVELTDGSRSYSIVEVTGIPSGVGTQVTVSSDFTLTDGNTSTTRIGFVLFGTQDFVEQSGPDPESYLAYINEPGGFTTPIFSLDNRETGSGIDSDPFTVFTGALDTTSFNLTAVATIGATALTVDYTLTDLNDTTLMETAQLSLDLPVDALLEPILPSGNYFGYAIDKNSSGPASSIVFDNFSVSAVPEPTSLVLLGLGTAALCGRRRG